MIPRRIHYCWFGKKPLTKEALRCIESWKKFCPDYEIIRWDERNYNIGKNHYARELYRNKKWAFLTDYARLDVVYEYGGIYLDTDVELLKPLDELLTNEAFFGMEQPGRVNTGIGFGAVAHHPLIEENKKRYENESFILKNGKIKKVICVEVTTEILNKYGLISGNTVQELPYNTVIYPTEYFCPLKMGTNKVNITSNTYSIHHFDGSWKSNSQLMRKINYYSIPFKQAIKRTLRHE